MEIKAVLLYCKFYVSTCLSYKQNISKTPFFSLMEKPWKICVMKTKDNSNINIIYKFEIVRLCYKKVIQDFLAVRPVIFIGGTVSVVR